MKKSFKKWIRAAGIRAIRTMAQTMVATIGATAAFSDIHWLTVSSAALLAGVLSLLTSIAGLPELKEKEE